MRLLAGADFHGDHEVCSWFVTKACGLAVDAIVLAGDILGFPGAVDDPEADQAIDARRLEADLLTAEKSVLFIMGNDDLINFEPSSERFLPLHGRRIEMGDFNFVGYQYSLPWMGGIFEKPDDEIAADLESSTWDEKEAVRRVVAWKPDPVARRAANSDAAATRDSTGRRPPETPSDQAILADAASEL